MALLKKNLGAAGKVGQAVTQFKGLIANQGQDLGTTDQVQALISVESMNNEVTYNNLMNHLGEVGSQIEQIVEDLGFESFDTSTELGRQRRENAIAAGAIAAMAAGDPVAYARQAYSTESRGESNVRIVEPNSAFGAAGSLDYREKASMEAFNDRELREFLPYSIAFNIFAQRQDDFSETLFPTTVVTPDQAGIDVAVSRLLVFQEVRHSITGQAANFHKLNLIDAAVDYTILGDKTTRLIPVVQDDGSNADKFVDSNAVGSYEYLLSGVAVPTAPLRMGKDIDLLGISSYQPLIGAGIIDNTDDIDARIELSALYLGTGTDGTSGDALPAVKFNTSRLPRSTFVKTPEGNYREMGLQFHSQELVIDKNTKAVDGSTVDAFSDIASNSYTVRLKVRVNGFAQVEFGNVNVSATAVHVASILDEDGNPIALDKGTGKTIVDALEALSFIGYDLAVNRTNANRRTRGHLLDTTLEVERYTIALGSPLSVPSPATSVDAREASDLKALIAAARIRNSNNAVTAMFNIADSLKAFVASPRLRQTDPGVGGLGRFLVKPFFEEHTLDLTDAVNSLKSYEKAADVAMAIVNAIRDVAYRMYRDSYYQPAVDALTGAAGEKPVLFIGTDQVLHRHIMVSGDTRTFGTAFDKFEVRSTVDYRMHNKIVLTFIRPGSEGPDVLSFGTHAWIPELTSSVTVNRNGATIRETMVQPRTLHFNNLPVMAVINIEGLSQVLGDQVEWPAQNDAIANPWLPQMSDVPPPSP